ncbi:formylglycine-generating enzyme family protein [Candidatus Electronema sp. PJ]|uniref:formylglycine-generating enzyme family protein n=1 Tax=Candidatus Electronema sp. PJ TaxID=3401572 RepID=UPI003AA8AE72
MLRRSVAPVSFPPSWASSWGEDAYGLWLTLSLNGIRQLFRWIRPGSFFMGAPAEESAGYVLPGKETQHEVILSKGFWLAETVVSQELWQAVMKNNPSGFAGLQQPVERVSWLNAQQFLRRLNALIPGLSARLPTEAEWEYACRAGSVTPFSFGEEITTEQVNYNAAEEEGGLCRRQTIEVKSLPANAWGLYEMHGNVWEWCQDSWQDDLGNTSVIDPQAQGSRNLRVVKGGSWVCTAGYVRSASRDRYYAEYNGSSIGFRLAV